MAALLTVNRIIGVSLFGTLAGLSLVALGIVASIQYYWNLKKGRTEAQAEAVNKILE